MDRREAARLLRQYVQTALAERAGGGSGQAYDQLVMQFNNINRSMQGADNLAEEHAVNLLKALTCCVSLLTRKHDALLRAVFSVRLWTSAPDVRGQVLDLLINLIVANAVFAHSCFNHLVTNLLPPPAPPAPDLEAGRPWTAKQSDIDAQDAVIQALEKTMSLVPTAHTTLEPMLLSSMPHKLRDRNAHCLYLRAVLRLCEGPSGTLLTPPLLRGVVEHLLAMDVEIRWEDIVDHPDVDVTEEDGSADEEQEAEDLWKLGEMAHDLQLGEGRAQHGRGERDGWEGAAAGTAGGAEQQGGAEAERPPVDEAADKLDSMMELVFEHLQRRCQRGEVLAIWQAVITGFEATLLRTPRSKFTQYLLFFLCLQSPSHCCASFLATLLRVLRDPLQPPTTRASAAAYLASFLARAAFVPPALLVSTLKDLAAICRDYARSPSSHNLLLHSFPSPSDGPPTAAASAVPAPARPPAEPLLAPTGPPDALPPHLAKHQVFYAMVQALLYVLCYHLRPLLHGPPTPHSSSSPRRRPPPHADAVRDLVTAAVQPLLDHPLRPLDVCVPSIAEEFARQAAALRVADVHPLLAPANAPSRAHRPLEMFFPFDPFLLHRSSRHLALPTSYVVWRHGHAVTASSGRTTKRRANAAHLPSDDDGDDDSLSTSSAGPHDDPIGASDDGLADGDDDGDANTNASVDGESSDSSSDDDDIRSASTRSGSLAPGSLPGSLPFSGSTGLLRPRPVGHRGGSGGRGGGGVDVGASFSPGAGGMDYAVYGGSPFGTSPPVAMSITPDMGFFAAAMAARGGRA